MVWHLTRLVCLWALLMIELRCKYTENYFPQTTLTYAESIFKLKKLTINFKYNKIVKIIVANLVFVLKNYYFCSCI